ncbi:OmpA family protein [bacterium]|nr:OmpA family protein [bacterium]
MSNRINYIITFICILTTVLSARLPVIFLKGKQYLEKGQYKEALDIFEQVIDMENIESRDKLRVKREMVTAYIGIKDWDSAARELNAILEGVKDSRKKAVFEELLSIVSAPEDPAVRIINLGANVNSSYEELAPVISPDGDMLYFIVDGNPQSEGKQDIYYSQRNENGEWGKAANIGKPLNTNWHDGILSISPSGTSALLAGVYERNGSKDSGFSTANISRGIWREPVALDIADYYNNNRLTSAFMASGGNVLFLALERNGGFGDLDIYISRAVSEGSGGAKWSSPLNLGKDINTRGTDGTPFLAPDGKTLYFSSNGRVGLGSQDMYKSERLDDSWKRWSKPVNLGKQVNTAGWDAYYTIPAKGDVAYFVSSADGGYGMSDIWMITLPSEARPGAVVTISGRVMEPDSTPVEAQISWEKLTTGENIGAVMSNDLTGEYLIVLPVGEAFGYVAEKEGYLPASAHLDLIEAEAYSEMHHDIFISPIQRGAQTVLKNVFFDFDKAILRPESVGELNRVKTILDENKSLVVEIAGHTDSLGTFEYNNELSAKRAQAVADWLIENGIDKERIEVRGYGESNPISENSTEVGQQENRRVVFEIIDL